MKLNFNWRSEVNNVGAERIGCAASEFNEKVDNALGRCTRNLRVNTAGESLGRLAREFVAACRAGDADGVKGCRFDEDGGCRGIDLGGCTTHHAGNADRAGFVGDEQVFTTHCALYLVESRELFASLRTADGDSTRKFVEVVAVSRLAEFHHDVVGNVDGK